MGKRVAHYINQFYGGIGGEEAAGAPLAIRDGPIGPGIALQKELGEGYEIVMTMVCGDNYYAENSGYVANAICSATSEKDIDLLVAGPAFNAGRYGLACGGVCAAVARRQSIPTVTAMYEENPAAAVYKKDLIIVATAASAAGMKDAIRRMARLAKKMATGEAIQSAKEEGYIPRGRRLNQLADKPAAVRAVEMLHRKLKGEPYMTEAPVERYESVDPAKPIKDLAQATIALVTEAGIVPLGNPDRIKHANATNWASYSLEGIDHLETGQYEAIHGGFDASFANEDPNRVLPVDAMRFFEAQGYIGKLHDAYYVTVGNGAPVERSARFGQEIARELLRAEVHGVLIPSS
ncbi:MAG: glycine/betaine/sarcosine/D-proline family reductase selenoprotein B [Firmicutes bacterium]|nr:glycine/betaine/sarcosine/D-proline family reductase selenoprotein B [Bacillota bacterium]